MEDSNLKSTGLSRTSAQDLLPDCLSLEADDQDEEPFADQDLEERLFRMEATEAQQDLWADCLSLGSDEEPLDESLLGYASLPVFKPDVNLLADPTTFDTGKNQIGDLPLQAEQIPGIALHQEQQQKQQVSPTLIDGAGEHLLPLNPEETFTAKDEKAEINSMSAAEIVEVHSDLYGITTSMSNLAIGHDSSKLQELEVELSRLHPQQTVAYYRAVIECPGLVSDERKTAFLDREDNDPVLAATRLALYWEFRLALFGPERCFLPMTLSGAMRDEAKNIVERRIFQLLPVTDTAGRAILFLEPSRRNFAEYSIEQEMMSVWYLLEVAMENPEVQRRGFVFVMNAKYIESKHFSRTILNWLLRIMAAFPIRQRAAHCCYPNAFTYFVIAPVGKLFLGRDVRRRIQLHHGSTAEVLKTLEAVCLPRDRLPTDVGGDITLDMAKWVSERQAFEDVRPDPCLLSDQQAPEQLVAKKRMRSDNTMSVAEDALANSIGHHNAPPVKTVRPSNPVMIRANEATLADPIMSPLHPVAQAGLKFDSTNRLSAGVQHELPVSCQAKKKGRKSDSRMTRAIQVRLANPDLPPLYALEQGGFVFDRTDESGNLIDADNITLTQRRNQLARRVRQIRNAWEEQE